MLRLLHICQLLISISLTLAVKNTLKTLEKLGVELPICPTNVNFFPQELPLHCRMPRQADFRQYMLPDNHMSMITLPPEDKFNFQRLPPGLEAPPLPFPPPGMGMPPPGMPPMPPGLPPMPQGLPPMPPAPPPGMPSGFPLPGPIPMPVAGPPPHKLPVIVMPFYSPDRHAYKKPRKHHKRPHIHTHSDTDTHSDTSTDDSDEGWWKGHKKKRRHSKYGVSRRSNSHHNVIKRKKDVLTPILQYVTKDGYVIFEKTISRNEANDWLGPNEQAKIKSEEMHAVKNAEMVEPSQAQQLQEFSKSEEGNKENGPKKKIQENISKDSNEIDEGIITDVEPKDLNPYKGRHVPEAMNTLHPGPQP